MTRSTRVLVGALAGMLLVGSASSASSAPDTPRAPAPKGSQRAALVAAAHGVYRSDLGTLEFRSDGTASFSIVNCGFETRGLAQVKLVTDCAQTSNTRISLDGKLTVKDHGYGIQVDATGTTQILDAYIGDTGDLHVGLGDVGYLGRTRRGTVKLPLHDDELTVGNGTCSVRDPFHRQPVVGPCRFLTRDGRQVLRYRGRDPFDSRKTTALGLVYLPKTGLVVAAELEASTFAPSP